VKKRTKTEPRRKGPSGALRPFACGIDWITCTATDSGSGGELWAFGDSLIRQDDAIDDTPVPWQMKGYRGWHTSHTRLGSRPGSVLLSLSGQKSVDNWRNALATAENCSRLDCAVDVTSDPPMPTLAGDIYRDMGHRPLRNGRPSTSRLILGSDGGSTVYIGSRQSEFFGRVYDKGVEQQTHSRGQWWRWELEVKGDSAYRVAHRLLEADVESAAIGSIVGDWFRERSGWCLPFPSAPAISNGGLEPTSTDRKLLWLSRQVRPTVIELLRRREAREILIALGLPQSEVAESSGSID
jgi:hypothetical protein